MSLGSDIFVGSDGDTLWLECFAESPLAPRGVTIRQIEPGDFWPDVVRAVQGHCREHGCKSGTEAE